MADDRKITIELDLHRNEHDDPTRPFKAVLELETGKGYRGGLKSDATVFWVGDHSRQHAFGVGDPAKGDYSVTVAQSDRSVRATQKAIDKQHAEVFTPELIATLTSTAKSHYGNKYTPKPVTVVDTPNATYWRGAGWHREDKTFNFELSPEDQASVETITRRAVAVATAANIRAITAQAVMMDVTVCHNHAVPLDLAGLAVATNQDFTHDVFGIVQKLDRRTGELTDCFTPRYFRKDDTTNWQRCTGCNRECSPAELADNRCADCRK